MGRPKVGVLVKGGRGVYGRWGRWIWGKDKVTAVARKLGSVLSAYWRRGRDSMRAT